MCTLSTNGSLDVALPIAILDDGRELQRIEVALMMYDYSDRPSVGKIEFRIIVFDPRETDAMKRRVVDQGNIGHLNRRFPGCRPHVFAVGRKLRDDHVS